MAYPLIVSGQGSEPSSKGSETRPLPSPSPAVPQSGICEKLPQSGAEPIVRAIDPQAPTFRPTAGKSFAIWPKPRKLFMIRSPGVIRRAAQRSCVRGGPSLALQASSRKLGHRASRSDPPIGQSEDGRAEQSPLCLDQCSSDLVPYRRCIDRRQALSPLDRPSHRVASLQRAPGETG